MTTQELINAIPVNVIALKPLRANTIDGGSWSQPLPKGDLFKITGTSIATWNPSVRLFTTNKMRDGKMIVLSTDKVDKIDAFTQYGQQTISIDLAIHKVQSAQSTSKVSDKSFSSIDGVGKYKLLQDYNNTVTGVKLYKGEVVLGTPDVKTNGMYIGVTKDGKVSNLADKFEIIKVDDATPIKNASQEQIVLSAKSESNMSVVGGIGTIAGLGFAYYKKSGFWGYVGYGILGAIVLGVGYNIISKPKN